MTLHTTLIEAGELAALAPADVLIVDCRFELAVAGGDPDKGERAYREAHIPGAVYAHLDHDLSDLSRQREGLGRHPLPLEQAFSAVLSRWGWRPGLQVVAYDAAGGALAAARLWWLLRLVGIREAAVLDGGFQAWQSAGLPLESGEVTREPTQMSLRYEPSQFIVDHRVVVAQPGQLLVDARAAPRYRGDVEPIDRVGGHVPGAVNRPYSENLDAQGRYKPAAQLREEFAALLGNTPPAQVVHMCGSGVTACHNLLAMEHAGLAGSRLYAPSWSGWVSDPERPVEKG
jgi:thiosulfate/3-mercaptopyruvate sulfurtransferase